MNITYHIHVNAFRISESASTKLILVGFFNDPFEPLESSYAPPNHFSFETENKTLKQQAWKKGVEILKQDGSFEGYIESETLSQKFSIRYADNSDRFLSDSLRFPLSQYKTVAVPANKHKQADLHVKRDRSLPRDELDSLMLNAGFYEVWTPRNRIYTLQFESVIDAKNVFFQLKEYFLTAKGIKQLNFEVVGDLIRFPSNFKMAKFLPKQERMAFLPQEQLL